MKWRQFFTPVTSLNGSETRELFKDSGINDVIYLDVRQPKEYEQQHLPGAKLIPLGELEERLGELDPEKPTIVY